MYISVLHFGVMHMFATCSKICCLTMKVIETVPVKSPLPLITGHQGLGLRDWASYDSWEGLLSTEDAIEISEGRLTSELMNLKVNYNILFACDSYTHTIKSFRLFEIKVLVLIIAFVTVHVG